MVNSSNLLNVGRSLALYRYQVESAVQERDGRQPHAIGMIGTMQLSILAGQWRSVEPNFTTYGLRILPLFSTLYKVFGGLAAEYFEIDRNDNTVLSRIHLNLESFSDFILEHTPKIVQLSLTVSIVAMAALGHMQLALFQFASLALSYIKRNGYLPSFIDKLLTPIADLSSFIYPFLAPVTLIEKGFLGAYMVMRLYYYLLYSPIGSYLFPSYTPKLPSSHVIIDDRTPSTYSLEQIKMFLSEDYLTVNPTSIYSDHVSNLLPPELDADLLEDKEKHFRSFERKIENEGVELNDFQKQGLENLKIGLLEGRFGDQTPINLPQFQKMLTAMIISLLRENVDFASKVQELSEIGNNCNEGWLREILFLLKPEAQNADWAVHYELAKLRSQYIHQLLQQLQREMEATNVRSISLEEIMGGANNVHLSNTIQAALWAWFRTYEGEQYFRTRGCDPILQFLINNINIERNTRTSVLNTLALLEILSDGHPLAITYGYYLVSLIDSGALQNFYHQPEFLTDTIYQAIYPFCSEKGEISRKIQWDAITSWMADISERVEHIDFYDSDNGLWNPFWVEEISFGNQTQFTLTREGVGLLLWDLGILERTYDNSSPST